MAARKPPVDDTALFRAVMHDVKPLARRRRETPADERPPQPPAPQPGEPVAAPRPLAAAKAPPPPNPGIDRRTAERLRKGEIAIDRRIDLHGMTQDDAHAALDRFVRQAWKDGKRMLLVITGKGSVAEGGGVLRRQVPRWLAAGEHARRLLRLEQAQPRHGGSGALYVLLRRQREPS
jgi:DNA-nicking Smr family endonuclease